MKPDTCDYLKRGRGHGSLSTYSGLTPSRSRVVVEGYGEIKVVLDSLDSERRIESAEDWLGQIVGLPSRGGVVV